MLSYMVASPSAIPKNPREFTLPIDATNHPSDFRLVLDTQRRSSPQYTQYPSPPSGAPNSKDRFEGENRVEKGSSITALPNLNAAKLCSRKTESVAAALASGISPTPSSSSSLGSLVTPLVTSETSTGQASSIVQRPSSKLSASNKQTSLKRVSFGSSKGSMVETLIYETAVQEEPEIESEFEQCRAPSRTRNLTVNHNDEANFNIVEGVKTDSSKVKVSFFESADKYSLECVDSSSNIIANPYFEEYESEAKQWNPPVLQISQECRGSVDSGWDNPFRPDGDLSKEADEIVELFKGVTSVTKTQFSETWQRPIIECHTSTLSSNQNDNKLSDAELQKLEEANLPAVEIQLGLVATPSEETQIEQLVIKKRPKCKCCIIQ